LQPALKIIDATVDKEPLTEYMNSIRGGQHQSSKTIIPHLHYLFKQNFHAFHDNQVNENIMRSKGTQELFQEGI